MKFIGSMVILSGGEGFFWISDDSASMLHILV